jgi:membrane-bound lytic murein transglycosylase MltF
LDIELMVRLIQLQMAQGTLGSYNNSTFGYKGVEEPVFSVVLSAMLESSKSTGERAIGSSSKIHSVYGRQRGNNSAVESVDKNGPDFLPLMVEQTAKKYGLDQRLLNAVVKAESDYNPKAVSSAGAMGLMQLMPATAKSLGVRDPFNPRENLEGGAKYLRSLIDRYKGNIKLALAAYNAGPGAVERYKGVPPYKETISYIKKINNLTNGMIM